MNRPKSNVSVQKPLFLLLGDSTIKHVTGYDLKKGCTGANIMVRGVQGSKIKNIKNLVLDKLEDVTPAAVCVDAGTNDIINVSSVEQIVSEIDNLARMLLSRGIHVKVPLLTIRNDRFSQKVHDVNIKLVELCRRLCHISNTET